MLKIVKPALLILINFMFLHGVYCQKTVNITDYLSEKFSGYTKSVPREEIYIHTDREGYISGEDLWFNIYLMDRQSFKPSTHSKIAYIELLNPDNRPVVQKRIWLNDGFGPGQIVLPDTLSTGKYTIRAYTSWMKNFLPFNCFTKDIQIFNSFSTRIFKGKSNSGKIIPGSERTSGYPLLPITGITLKVDNLKPDILDITVITDEKYRSLNNNKFYLFIQTHGIIDRVSSETTYGETVKISIPKNQLTSGINQITVFNSKGQPIADRLIYTSSKEDPPVILHSADSTGLRNKVSLDAEFGKELSSAFSRGLSISVTPKTNVQTFPDISDYMVFGTEYGILKGKSINYAKVDKNPPDVLDSFLSTLKSNWIDWNVILSDELPVIKYNAETEDHYLTGRLMSNDKKTVDSGMFVILSIPSKTAVFQYAKTDKEGFFSFKIHIDNKVNDLVIQPDITARDKYINIESPFSVQYLKPEKSIDTTAEDIPEYISTLSVNHQVRKIYGSSSVGEPLIPQFLQPKVKRFYGKPDQELIMKDYIALPVMQEVFFELLAGVLLKSKKSGYEITISNPENNKPYETPPSLFIDGVMVKEPSVIAGLEPDLVEKIDVVRVRYFVGDYQFHGIVNIITKAGDFSSAPLPDQAMRLHYRVIDPVSSFSSPDYSSSDLKKSRIPDFRNTLYWNPSVKPDKEGKARIDFWTSDFISDFEINIQGITSDGKPFSLKKIIKIKK
jgi:hypothetical protein